MDYKRFSITLLAILISILVLSPVAFSQDTTGSAPVIPPELLEDPAPAKEEVKPKKQKKSRKKDKKSDINKDKGGKKKKGFFGRIFSRNKAPRVPEQWHKEVKEYYNLQEGEFFQYGYAMTQDEWYPIMIYRHFVRIKKQYQHTLIVKGRPNTLPRVKGISLNAYGMEVKDEGFQFILPTFASVDRRQKELDEEEFIKLAESKLKEFGFDKIFWLKDKSEEVKDIADTWSN